MKLKALSLALPLLCFSQVGNASLIITEVLYDAPNNDSTEEFVEIYNTSCDSVSLSGYSIADNAGSFNLSGTIAGGSYLTIAKSSSAFQNLFGQSPDITGMSLGLGNSGDKVSLKNGSTEVDMVAWENHVSGWSINAKNVSIYRNKTTDNNSNSDWSVSGNAGQPGAGVFSGCDGSGGGGGGGTPPGDNALNNGQTVSNLSAGTNETLKYTIDVASGGTDLNVTMAGGSGDADLYVRFGSEPTSSSYDCRPYRSGNGENCYFASPQAGTHFINLVGYSAFSGVSLTASYTESTGGGGGGGGTNPPGYDYNTYYANAFGLSGSSLKSALNQIIKTGHNRLSYSEVWTALMYTDQDLNNANNVILLYTGRSVHKDFRAGQTNDQDAWNREHVWAKSHGFPSSGQWGYTDINHLRPADVSVNSSRGNKDFDNGGSAITEAPGTYTDSDSFEPADNVKGDVARMVLYMDVRYEGGDSSGTPDLSVVDYTGTSTGDPLLGKLCTLLAWHAQDPVSSWEQRRNNRVFEKQGNRNPFIDNPAWVTDVFGSCQ